VLDVGGLAVQAEGDADDHDEGPYRLRDHGADGTDGQVRPFRQD
jgi:hypothetical protein